MSLPFRNFLTSLQYCFTSFQHFIYFPLAFFNHFYFLSAVCLLSFTFFTLFECFVFLPPFSVFLLLFLNVFSLPFNFFYIFYIPSSFPFYFPSAFFKFIFVNLGKLRKAAITVLCWWVLTYVNFANCYYHKTILFLFFYFIFVTTVFLKKSNLIRYNVSYE